MMNDNQSFTLRFSSECVTKITK